MTIEEKKRRRFAETQELTEPERTSSSVPSASTQLWALLRTQRGAVALLAIGSILCGFTESGVLAIFAQTATALVTRTSSVHANLGPFHVEESVGVLLVFGLALAIARLGLQVVISVVPARIMAEMQARLRTDLFAAFTRASWSEQSRDRDGHLQELLSNQVGYATQSAQWAALLVVAALTFLVLTISALVLNVLAALCVLVAAIGLFAILRPLNNLSARRGRALSREFMGYAGGVSESIRLAEEAHVFGAGIAQRERADELVAPVTASVFHTYLLTILVPGLYQSLIYLLVVAALAALYLVGGAPIPSLGAVVLLLVRAGMYGQQVQAAHVGVRQTLPYLERVQQAQHRYAASIPVTGQRSLGTVRTLAFQTVCFSYEPDRPTLSDVEFEVFAGEAVGIVGPSGAGKSTLVQLLLRLRTPDSGRYLINDLSADEFRADDWHARFAYVPQEPRLLHASVSDNIRFFRNLDSADVERAARLAGIHDEVMEWPARYDTLVGPRADAVSGGQQQRICLARALAGHPDVLVLDEPTSALDPHAESLIQQSLAALKHKLTLFVVAHRLSTLDICERAMVVVNGRLEAFDKIEVLRRDSAYYRSVSGGRSRSVTADLTAPSPGS